MSFFKRNKILVTHNGTFHADDLFATAVFSILYNGNIKVIRTRDPKIIESADIVYDTGGVYDASLNRFDHHQMGGAGLRPNGIPYASFGLVWKTYGEQICGSKEVSEKIDEKIAQHIDAIDNGVDFTNPIYGGSVPYGPDVVFMNNKPTWKEENKDLDTIFNEQTKKVKEFLLREIEVTKSDTEAINIMVEAYKKSENKKIVIIDNDFPRYLYQDTMSRFPEPIYLVFPSGHSNMWKVEAISKAPNTMENRKLFPESWRGYLDEDPKLKEITGVPEVIFCHKSGFLIVAHTKEAAIALAQKALIA